MWHFAFLGLIPFVLTGTTLLRAAALDRARQRARVASRLSAVRVATQPAHVDIMTALGDVLAALDPLASRHLTRISLAVPDGLAAWAVPHRVRLELHERLQTAIRRSPCGRVLVTGRQIHDEVLLSVTEDAAIEAPSVICFPTPSPRDAILPPAAQQDAPWDATMRATAAGLQKVVATGAARPASAEPRTTPAEERAWQDHAIL
jgi:hypothetical protein